MARGKNGTERESHSLLSPLLQEFIKTSDDFPRIARLIEGSVVSLSHHAEGCRLLQCVLPRLATGQILELAKEFHGNICAAVASPHANFVLQLVIILAPPAPITFIVDELSQEWNAASVARHKYGCRIMERIIEHFDADPKSRRSLAAFLDYDFQQNIINLCFHPFGNFVMQHLIEYQVQLLDEWVSTYVLGNVRATVVHKNAGAVLRTSVTALSVPRRRCVLLSLLAGNVALIQEMLYYTAGREVLEDLLRVANEEEKEQLRRLVEYPPPISRRESAAVFQQTVLKAPLNSRLRSDQKALTLAESESENRCPFS